MADTKAENTVKQTVEKETTEDDLCCIEASVVTGFEECARGEAKEKFGTPVQAARGKIVWKVPIDRVNEVVKMGSIDNCRVVLHSVSHFKFTNDQHDDLSRLQKMLPDMDWDKGLRVWRRFFDFAHPIVSKPDVIPSPEELVDVVIIERTQFKDPNSRRNNKKGGRGKKKEKKKERKSVDDRSKSSAEQKNEETHSDMKNITDEKAAKSDNPESAEFDAAEKNTNENFKSESFTEVNEEISNMQENEKALQEENSVTEKDTNENSKSESASDNIEGCPKSQEACRKPTQIAGRTSVIIKRHDPNVPQPKIEVKVLIPGPSENAFPTHVEDKDHRDVEPMDVDMSMNAGIEQSALSDVGVGKDKDPSAVKKEKDTPEEQPSDIQITEIEDHEKCGENKENRLEKIASATKDFASSVIERLKLSSPPVRKDMTISQEKVNCTTPPSTPVILATDPMKSSLSASQTASPEATDNLCDAEEVIGSSVDPPASTQSSTETKNSAPETVTPSEEKENDPSLSHQSVDSESAPGVPPKSEVLSVKTETKSSLEEKSGENPSNGSTGKVKVKKERDPMKPTFRVTCNRVGENHAFDSASAAASLGSSIIRYFNWGVDLKNFDIEVLLNIDNEEVTVGIGLTKSSLHNRNLVAFGPTTLRATICYNMLRLCRIKTGDIICDPLCGTSALSIEGSLNWTNSFHFGGDYHELAIERSLRNATALNEKLQKENKGQLKIGLVQWNLNYFPLRDKCVDVFVSDLPFGHRMGSRTINRTLYPTLLSEMARTGRPGARACLLTEDKTSLIKAIQTFQRFWQRRLILSINMGGLSGFVFLLTRTTASFSAPKDAWRASDSKTTPAGSPNPTENAQSQAENENSKEPGGETVKEEKQESSASSSTQSPDDVATTSEELPKKSGEVSPKETGEVSIKREGQEAGVEANISDNQSQSQTTTESEETGKGDKQEVACD